jgi:hypothetical protein
MTALCRLLLLAATLCLADAAHADPVYRWIDKDGVVHYGDRPPANGAKPVELPPLQTMESSGSSAIALPLDEPAPATPAYGPLKLHLSEPQPEETIRGAEAAVTIRVVVDGVLPPGAAFVYLLDGNRMAGPIREPTYTLAGVDRGSHLVSAAVLAPDGRELGRAAPVIVHVKPPIATRPANAR